MKNNIEAIAGKTGLEAADGVILLGRDARGSDGTPGGRAARQTVSYYLTPRGVRAVVDTRYGSNQGCIEWHGGDVARYDEVDLDAAIMVAGQHVEDADETRLRMAFRLATSAAKETMRLIDEATEATVAA